MAGFSGGLSIGISMVRLGFPDSMFDVVGMARRRTGGSLHKAFGGHAQVGLVPSLPRLHDMHVLPHPGNLQPPGVDPGLVVKADGIGAVQHPNHLGPVEIHRLCMTAAAR